MRGREPAATVMATNASPVGDPPGHLTAAQARVWRELQEIAPAHVCTAADRPLWEALVVALDTFRTANRRVRKNGLVVPANDKSTYMVQNPYLIIRTKQAEIVYKLSAQLGFDPGSRGRLKVAPRTGAPSKLAQLMNRTAS